MLKGFGEGKGHSGAGAISLRLLPVLTAVHCLTHVAAIVFGSCTKQVFKTNWKLIKHLARNIYITQNLFFGKS